MFAELTTTVTELAEPGHGLFRGILPFALFGILVVIAIHLALTFSRRRASGDRPSWNWWERLVYLATLASVAVLGITAFYAVLASGTLGGWSLFAHMFGAGLFTVVLPVLALTWCEANWCCCGCASAGDDQPPVSRFSRVSKLTFWLILASGLVVTGTMLLSMLPLFGTHGLELLLEIHRWAGLIVVVAAVLHLYGVLAARLRLA